MPVRTLTAQQPGPVLIDTQLLGAGGTVTVRSDASRTEAEITIRTADESGTSADAVRDADLYWDSRGALVAHVQGTGGINGGGTFITGSNFGVVQHVQNNVGSVVMVSGGDLNVGGSRYQFHGISTVHVIQGAFPVEITAVVPEGCSVTARTQSADVITDGTFAAVSAHTQSGDAVSPARASGSPRTRSPAMSTCTIRRTSSPRHSPAASGSAAPTWWRPAPCPATSTSATSAAPPS
ncbi:hypothetical protein ADK47_16665 [Streptomyces rimosus subsp. rimosus]|uniref:Uncharacterized protein n=1 Tax=Streptomyces rimosus subsp. rimosus TaxID=132474 RepID=A0ABY3ZEV9_STRRM|nr:hypothetical protein [Streptomyces rimosus]KOT38760.1 hypothetical protein ADK84_16355 [Streptomyces sp. NRRL WC-3701]KOT38660.1 hypothetical protein ADK42_17110 [Streptomyces rimosus subsp. rimosus]KOT79407.1 hypothetical protein ADK47_16665 [Streptomyces rimosus subsp. rimosus]KUJ35176.1 hypothetical protein ADK46_17170 [Streptomyces rimosus subsp. rimosus]UNZ08714.1 hypothetical protein SRIMR7_41845 [Streptomyces rimosus subsp. rimosus]